jgi:hypothetical protein
MLNTAAAFCIPAIFALLLAHSADISQSIPLHYAAGHGQSLYGISMHTGMPMMEYLVNLGLDVHATDDAMKIAFDRHG